MASKRRKTITLTEDEETYTVYALGIAYGRCTPFQREILERVLNKITEGKVETG